MTFTVDPKQDVRILRDDRPLPDGAGVREGAACRIYRVQAGFYRDLESAAAVAARLTALGFHAFVL